MKRLVTMGDAIGSWEGKKRGFYKPEMYFDQAEKQELTNHLEEQIEDCDQMIVDTQQQIKEIQDQILRINSALEQRQAIIKDQI